MRPHTGPERRWDGVFASFTVGPYFEVVQADLAFYDEVVSTHSLSLIDEADARVDGHGLRCRVSSGHSTRIHDVHLTDSRIFFRYMLYEHLRGLNPNGKSDLDAVDRAIDAGFPIVEPILSDLLMCIQDANWPIAKRIWPFLVSMGEPLVPHIEAVLEGDDDVWKYWCLSLIGDLDAEVQLLLLPKLRRIAERPTPGETTEEVAAEARLLIAAIAKR